MIDHELHYLLLVGFHQSNRIIVNGILKAGLMPGQPKILEFLSEHDGATQKDISAGCVLDKSTVTSLLSRMLEHQLVEKKCDPHDGRAVHIFLTENGRRQAAKVKAICEKVDNAAFENIPPAEQEQFIRTFHQILNNLRKAENN